MATASNYTIGHFSKFLIYKPSNDDWTFVSWKHQVVRYLIKSACRLSLADEGNIGDTYQHTLERQNGWCAVPVQVFLSFIMEYLCIIYIYISTHIHVTEKKNSFYPKNGNRQGFWHAAYFGFWQDVLTHCLLGHSKINLINCHVINNSIKYIKSLEVATFSYFKW